MSINVAYYILNKFLSHTFNLLSEQSVLVSQCCDDSSKVMVKKLLSFNFLFFIFNSLFGFVNFRKMKSNSNVMRYYESPLHYTWIYSCTNFEYCTGKYSVNIFKIVTFLAVFFLLYSQFNDLQVIRVRNTVDLTITLQRYYDYHCNTCKYCGGSPPHSIHEYVNRIITR